MLNIQTFSSILFSLLKSAFGWGGGSALLTFFFPWMLFSFLDLAAEKSS